jgi:hypothetical protein
MELETVRCSPSFRGGEIEVSGKIDDVHNIRIHYVNVLDQENQTFTCEIEFEADLHLDLNVEVLGRYHSYDDYAPDSYTTSKSIYHVFGAEVVARFHPKAPEDLEFESVSVYGNSVKPSADQIADRLFL